MRCFAFLTPSPPLALRLPPPPPRLLSPESIRKVLDKQAIKFVRAIRQDTRSGKTEDKILVRDTATPCLSPSHCGSAGC